MIDIVFGVASCAALAFAQASDFDINRRPPQPQVGVCGEIINQNLYGDGWDAVLFKASKVVDCLTSVPFDPAVGIRLLDYLDDTYQFHATTAYQKNPPSEYQQSPLDLFGELQQIRTNVGDGAYNNQYAFETAVLQVLQHSHDQHLNLYGGISAQFDYMSLLDLVSVSRDGKEKPEIYLYYDLVESVTEGGFVASPISHINGIPAASYLTEFAKNQSFGMVETNAEWNQLMASPAQELFGTSSFSEAASFYPGDELTFNFENSSEPFTSSWYAFYTSAGFTGPLETGGDFYNFFVLGLAPANFDDQYDVYIQNRSSNDANQSGGAIEAGDDDDDAPSNSTSWHDLTPGYPADTMMHQADLGLFTSGIVTGYFLAESSTAVLSIPSFELYGDGADTFEDAITDFISNATSSSRNAQKVIIDLQQNQGGLVGLAYFVFDQLFPNTRPFSGSRMRSHASADALGRATTAYFNSLTTNFSDVDYLLFMSSEWTITNRINAETSRNFTSWEEFRGPLPLNDGTFSLTERLDLSNPSFVENVLGTDMDSCSYTQDCTLTAPWKAEDIVLLTDGTCGSTCALFVEMMHQAGVRAVVMGGLPDDGPMQTASGSRGALAYSGDEIDDDYALAQVVSNASDLSSHSVPSDTGVLLTYTGLTLLDQVRQGQPTPNQVLYMPADCRLYWTLANFYNYTRLWSDVHSAAFIDPSICVPGSTNVTQAPPRQTSQNLEKRSPVESSPEDELSSPNIDLDEIDLGLFPEEPWDGNPPGRLTVCDPKNPAKACHGAQCKEFKFDCLDGCRDTSCQKPKSFFLCSNTCHNGNDNACPGSSGCNEKAFQAGNNNGIEHSRSRLTVGQCVPKWSKKDKSRQCSSLTPKTLPNIVASGGP